MVSARQSSSVQTEEADFGMRRGKYWPVAGFLGYRVGRDGSVWSCLEQKRLPTGYGCYIVIGKTWKLLRPWTKKKTGHKVATLYRDGRQHRGPVHTLVLEAFIGPRPKGAEACHDDGNPSNNTPGNLYWGTSADNGRDRARHGRMPKGEAHFRAKLTAKKVIRIKRRLASGGSLAEIARDYDVTPQCIYGIKKGLSWSHLG